MPQIDVRWINAVVKEIHTDRFIVVQQVWRPIDVGLVECFPANNAVIPRLRIGREVVVRGRPATEAGSDVEQLTHALTFSR